MPGARLTFEAIGTMWDIELFDDVPSLEATALETAVRARIGSFDKNYSRFRTDSLVSQMAREPGRYNLPEDAKPLLDMYQELYKVTKGLVTPLIGQTLSDAGYDANYSFMPGTVTAPPTWEDTLEYDFPHLLVKQPALLDFGAAGKGYLADVIAEHLSRQGQQNFAINAGGDFVYRSAAGKTLKIALEHPKDPESAIGIAEILNQSLCGSAGNRRKWGTYHHILHPKSLMSPQDITALWVVADSGLIADGLSTALFFVSPVRLRPRFTFSYAIVRQDMSLHHSPDFPAEFFTTNINKEP